MASADPFYNRKPVPTEFLEHVGPTGLTKQEELLSRERKLSTDHGDLRRFSNPKGKTGKLDPHYSRKPVPDELIKDVGQTGLTPQEEHLNREKKLVRDGVDLRKFSTSRKGGMEPQDDPYYGRKQVDESEIAGVGETGASKAEDYEVRDRKASIFDLSSDPFQQVTGAGHRQSISGVSVANAADARRRSSAVPPDAAHATAAHHSGYDGDKLAPIESRADGVIDATETVGDASRNQYNYGTGPTTTTATTTTTTTTTTAHNSDGVNQHGLYHDIATVDPDSVAPHEIR